MSDKDPRSHADLFRTLLFARDHSICAECGLHCDKKRAELLLMPRKERVLEMRRLGITDLRKSLWQAHHVVALSEGGANTLDNQITLCIRCHGLTTAQQNRRYGKPTEPETELMEVFG